MFKLILISLIFYSSSLWARVDVKTYIPPRAIPYIKIVYCDCIEIFGEFKYPEYFPALIEHESCISLTHSKCWNPKSRLKTSREEGAGLGQLTRAWRKDKTLRFDSLQAMRRKHSKYLKELSWSNIYVRPDLQIKAILLMSKDNWKQLYNIKDDYERLAMTDAAYNGGLKGLLRDRRACSLAKNCNPDIWFNNVEKTCTKSKRILYGNRSACDINRYHVKNVLKDRMHKYKVYLQKLITSGP